MNQRTIRQIRGASDLIGETVTATVTLIAETHRNIARQPYALLACIPGIALPVRMIEQIHNRITDGVYNTILSVNQVVNIAATAACDQLEAHNSPSPRRGRGG